MVMVIFANKCLKHATQLFVFLQRLSMKCGIMLNNFLRATVSHHRKAEINMTSMGSQVRFQHTTFFKIIQKHVHIIIKIFECVCPCYKSWIYFYINFTTLPGLPETFSKLGSVMELNSWPHEVMLISAFPWCGLWLTVVWQKSFKRDSAFHWKAL